MRRLLPVLLISLFTLRAQAQVAVCGTPGYDGPANVAQTINTYYPPSGDVSLAAGSTSLSLGSVPATDAYGNTFGSDPIAAGDLLLIIQIQDADINTTNSDLYGGNNSTGGPDGLGGTGYTALNNTGRYEYLVATSNVPLTGGPLTFRGGGAGNGTVYAYTNRAGTAVLSQKKFQVVRVPQYSNLTLTSSLVCPPWNGSCGGIVAFDVAGTFDFGGFSISANGRGFRAGYQDIAGSGANVANLYVTTTYDQASGKGENIAGTPRYMWDGFNAVDNGAAWNGFPGGDYGRGAPGNGGGGGNDHNAGGGGGGNGGAGGEGGIGWEGGGGTWPNGGRPGVALPQALGRAFLGGGGGGGDANNALTGVKGGVGGGLVIINAGSMSGTGLINANGDNGDVGAYGSAPDGAGGGGGGGTILLNITQNSPTANLNLSAIGGNGGNTLNDSGFEHGPGAGGGGGSIWYNATGATVATNVVKGVSGKANGGAGIVHGAKDGQDGTASTFAFASLPTYLQGQSSTCYPTLQVTKTSYSAQNSVGIPQGANTTYTITTTNNGAAGNAGGVRVEDFLPTGITYVSATVAYASGASGPGTLTNLGTSSQPKFGDFNVPYNGTVTITLTVLVSSGQTPGTYHNGAQVSYLDPTRTSANATRRISPATNSYPGALTTYEVGGGTVPGSNYSNAAAGPVAENVLILSYPVANDDAFTMNEDGTISGQSVKGNDTDADDAFANCTWSILSGGSAAANGTLSMTAAGFFTYTPTADYNGTVTFTYQMCDNDGLCEPATVTITITPVNDAPVGNNDAFSVNEDASISVQSVTGNDADIDNTNAQLTWSLVSGGTAAANGTLVFNANGTFNYAPNANYNGTVTFTYGVCDPAPLCDNTNTVTITVNPVNDAPLANDDTGAPVPEDGANGTVNLLTNDTDVDGNPSAPTNGAGQFTVDLDAGTAGLQTSLTNAAGVWTYAAATGVVTFDPANNYNGTATLTYTLCDPSGACDAAVITFVVTAVNDAPVANDDSGGSLTEDGANGTVNILTNDTDVDGAPTAPTNGGGQFTVDLDAGTAGLQTSFTNATGVWSYATATGIVTFDPANDYNGTTTLTYTLCDPFASCDPAVITFTVIPSNDPPIANDDSFSTNEDIALSAQNLAGNDSDVDNTNAQLTWALVSGGTAAANGSLTVNANGTFSFTPNTDFNGTVTFTYQVCDPSSACDPATVTITVNPVNDAPVGNNDNFTMLEGATLNASVSGNDSDPDNTNAQLTWSLVSGGTAAANGSLTVNANGTFSYAPNPFFNGIVTFTYAVCDPAPLCDNTNTVTIDVGSVNDPPIANDDGFSMSEDGALASQNLTVNDSDPDGDALTYSLLSGGSAAANGSLAVNANGTFNYTPTANYNGTVTFTYQACDPSSVCDQAIVTITVVPVNDAPVANDDNGGTLTEDGANGTVSILTNDTDADGNPSAPTNGGGQFTIDLDAGTAGLQTSLTNATGTWSYNTATGVVSFDPANDYNGTATLTYTLCDPSAACDPAVITFTVNAVNDGPIANDDSFTTTEDAALSNQNLAGNDSDVDNTTAQLTWSLVSGGTAAANGSLTVNANGTFSFTPSTNYTGTVTFTYQVCDPSAACDPATVTITVTPVNDAPVAGDDSFSTTEDVALTAQSVTSNDADPDNTNAQLTWSLVSGGTAATNGTLVFNANGTFTWTPNANYNGTVTFTYAVCDPAPLCDNTNTVTIVVTPANDPPVANDDSFTVNEDASLTAQSVTGNDSDVDNTNAQLTWSLVSGGSAAANGTLVFNANGTFNYTPSANYTGTVTFTYQVCDPNSACDPAVVTIVVSPVNDPPVANDDTFTMNEDGTLTAQSVTGNDSDPDNTNAQLTWSILTAGTAGANGTLSMTAAGAFTYTPNTNFNGTVSFTYQACDPSSACDPATVTITVTPVNDAPIANDDAFTVVEDGSLNNTVDGNDSDTETANAGLVWSLVSGGTAATNGTLVFDADGTFLFTPNANFNGAVTFTYQVCDPSTSCDPATVTIIVTPDNDAPVAGDDAFTMNEDGTLTNQSVTANDSDPDNTAAQLAWSLVSGGTAAANGSLVVNANGTFTFTPTANYNGVVTFTYQVCDPGNACDPATVTITVNSVNDAPVGNNDAFTMQEGGTLSNTVSGNDSDVDHSNAQLTWALLSGGTASANGSLTVNANGTFTYTPNPLFNGLVTFTYTLCDPAPLCDNTNTVTIDVGSVNDPPVASDDSFSTNEDVALTNQNLAGNDSDPDGDALTYSLLSGGSAAANGSLTVNANGTFSFTPNANYNGTVTFTYQACDQSNVCDQATVTITVVPVNDAPVANDDNFTTNEDVAITNGSLSSNDSDADNTNAQLAWNLLSGGTAQANGTLTVNINGTFNYVPSANFNGTVTFTYQVCDPGSACDPATVTITVVPVNDAPVANDDAFTMNEDGTLTAQSVTGNDSDTETTNASLVWSLVSGGTAAANGTLVFNANGTFNYTPNANFNGTVSFTYQLCDPGPLCDNAIVTITVNAVNDTPVAGDDAFTMNEDGTLTAQSVTGNDSDTETANASLTWSLLSGGTAAANGTLLFNANGTFNYTPNANFNGTVSFTYQLCDPGNACDPATVTITVNPVNDTPVANDDTFTMNEDATLANSVTGNDSDIDNTGAQLAWSLVSGGTAASNGVLVLNANGTFTYAPNADFMGTVSFTYQVCDPGPLCDPAIVTITVNAVNDAPVANDDAFTMNEDGTLTAQSVTSNDSDPDNTNAQLTWSLVSGGTAAANGTLVFNANGAFNYTPNANYNGTVTFTYQLCDPSNACDNAIVTITVNALNDTPVANDDSFTTTEDVALVNQSVTGNDADVDNTNAQLTWSLVSDGTAAVNGSLVFNANGTFTWTPNADFNGAVSFTYQVCDPASACDPAVVTITVNAANDAPVANDDVFSVIEDGTLNAQSVTGNDSDPDNTSAQLVWNLLSGGTAATNGTLVFNANGTFNYTPAANFNGTVTFTYQVCDPGNACDPSTVTITVTPANDGPIALDDSYGVIEDGTLTNSVAGNDSDVDNTSGQLTWSLVDGGSAEANGAVAFNADGSFTYIPDAGFNGIVTFTYQLCDNGPLCDQAVVTIDVGSDNDAPIAGDDVFTMNEDASLSNTVSGGDSDPDADALTWSLVNGGTATANGVLVLNADGTFTYTPNADFNGTISFTYQACDPSNFCDAANVTITVLPVNDAPVANDDSFGVNEDGSLTTTVTGNDSDVDDSGAALTWSLVDGGSAEANGTVTFNANGGFTYVPDAGFNGSVSFTYQLCDAASLCDQAVVTINVGGVNDPPIAEDDVVLINEDGVLTGGVTGNDSDPDGDALTWTLINGGTAATNGTLTFNADGSFGYVPDPDFNGTVTFIYEACDPSAACDQAEVTIFVISVNDAPVANDDSFTIPEDGSLSNTVAGNDSDVDGALTWDLVDGGTAAVNGTLVLNVDGTFSYTPNANFNGTVTFTYQACDPDNACDQAIVTITVVPANDAPVANDDTFTMNEDASLSSSVAGNDSDADNTNGQLIWSLVDGGSAVVNGSLTLNANGSFTYVPNPDFNGTVSFTYQLCDPGASCDAAVVTITVLHVNDAPVANDDAFSMAESTTLSGDIGANDSDIDGDALTWDLVDGMSAAANGTLNVNTDGTFNYTPNPGFNGAVDFTYQACDGDGLCADALVIITVGAVNDPPNIVDDVTSTNEDTPLIINVLGNDSDSDGNLDEGTVTITSPPGHGTATVNVDGSITYLPGTNYTGVDAFQYQVCDDGTPLPAQCGTAFVDITVLPLNDAPTAFDDGFTFIEDAGTLNADVTGNDYDIDDANSALVWSLVNGGTAAQNGALAFGPDGSFSYTPDANYYGFVSFTYQACDPGGQCEGATVFINVLPVNDPPVALGDLDNTLPDVPLTTNVSANDNDTTDLSTIDLGSITIIVPPDSGTVSVNGNGTITYTPNPGFIGNDTLVYQICDIGVPPPALCDTAILVIQVSNAYPLAVDDSYSLPEDSLLVMDVLDNDTALTGVLDPTTLIVINGPLQGTATVNPDGTVTYVPDPDYYGPDAFNYTVCTDLGFCSNATVLINVDPVNDPPIVLNDTVATDEDVAITFGVLGNDDDLADGALGGLDSLSVTIAIPPAHGTAGTSVDGSITYTPTPNFNGIDSLQYQVCDVGYPLPPECGTAWVIITVGEVNDPPVITDQVGAPIDTLNVSTPEDIPLQICFNAIDPEGDTLDATNSFLGPDFGIITGEADGDSCITYTPDPEYNGGDTVTVVICDNGGLCDTVVVVIDVTPVNDPPQVVDVIGDPADTVTTTTLEDTPVIICFDAIDIDGDTVEVSGVIGGPQNGTATGLADGDTCWTYTPDPDYNGTDTVTVLVCDDNGGCDTVLVIIDVTPVNDPPVITDGSGSPTDTLNVYTLEDLPVTVCLNATDVDGDSLVVSSIPSGPFNGSVSGLQDGDTCFTYAPDPGFLGNDTLLAVVDDGHGGTDTVVVIITVLETNDPPIIVDGGGIPIDTVEITTFEDTPTQLCLDAIDPEGLPVDITAFTPIDISGAILGLGDGDTCMTYSPYPNTSGTDTLYVFVCDGFGACDSVLVVIHIIPVDDPPVITDPSFVPIDTLYVTTETGTPLAICLDALDPDGDVLDVTAILNGPVNGIADSFNDGDTCFTYTPDPGYIGGDTLTAVVCDPSGACDTVLVVIDVTGSNNPPIIVDGNFADADTLGFTTPEDTPITICLTAIDFDGDTLDITGIFGGPSNGSANGIADGDTCFTYTPTPDWIGTDTLNAIVCDGNGGCDTVLIFIDVTPVNDPPIVVDGSGLPTDTLSTSTPEGIPVTVCVGAIDIDGDTLDVTAVIDDAANGSTSGIADGDTCFTYTPDPGFIGTDTVTVVICDNAGACDTVTVIIDVTPLNPNEPPIAVDDTASTAVGTAVTVDILNNDSDPDGDPLTLSSVGAGHGSVVINGDGSITYMPDSGFCGTDTITYTVCDPFLACDDAIVVVDVPCLPVNEPPIAVNDVANTIINTSVTVNVLGNDSDPNGDPITVTTASASHGIVTINGDGTITYTPDPLFCGTDTIFYTICDPGPLCDDALVVVDIPCPPVNDPPIAVDDSAFVDPNSDIQVAIIVLANDTDPNGDPLTVTNAQAANGTVDIGQNGELLYFPDNGFCGIDTITYTVCDPEPLCDEAYVFVTVECPDTAELAIPEGFSPNNDGYGDRWIIRGLERYPLAKVTIFNRWGNEVYSADPYHNDWDGRSTNGLTWDGVLPVATYWYLLDLGVEGEEVRSGYIYLNR